MSRWVIAQEVMLEQTDRYANLGRPPLYFGHVPAAEKENMSAPIGIVRASRRH